MDIDFRCVKCGNCCKALRLPLSVDEAIRWLHDGNPVQVLCEGIPWPEEPPSPNPVAAYKRERSFAGMSGELPIRILVTLAAPLGKSCPNLRQDNLCAAYDRRPAVCRAYPAEANPFLELAIERRRCPPESWLGGGSPLLRESRYVDSELRLLIRTISDCATKDVAAKRALCSALGINVAAMANEGYVAHAPGREQLLDALSHANAETMPVQNWEFMSNRAETVEAIRSCGALCSYADGNQTERLEYLSLFA